MPIKSNQKGHVLSERSESKGFTPIIILVLILVGIVGGVYLAVSLKNEQAPTDQSAKKTTDQITSIGKTNLNPNTGNLYSDIKVRLDEVLK